MIVLVGFMGAGKSSVGRRLAALLDVRCVDTDEEIERQQGARIADIFGSEGEDAFRFIEAAVADRVLGDRDTGVVALGGGSLTSPATRAHLHGATVVYLRTSYEVACARIKGPGDRPLAGPGSARIYAERAPVYEQVATITVDTDDAGPGEVAGRIASLVTEGPGRARVETPRGSYPVVVSRGAVARLPSLLPGARMPEKAALVTHPSLHTLAQPLVRSLEDAGVVPVRIEIKEGEGSKSLSTATDVLKRLSDEGFHRDDLVVAFGGGVVTDLAGFVAATYHRGVPLVNVPTTLLGQVDAAVGGKNAVNLPAAKNQVGTVHQPVLVLCDTGLLAGLAPAEYRSGLAEVVKHGLICDPSLLERVHTGGPDLLQPSQLIDELVTRSVRIKAGFVSDDELERGRRACLNYGHTFGHAFEHTSRIRHGEAIAIGMMAAAHLAQMMGWLGPADVELHAATLAAAGLPIGSAFDLDRLERVWAGDKKYRGGVRFVLLTRIGRAEPDVSAPREMLEALPERLAP